jgi:hypothetical protein
VQEKNKKQDADKGKRKILDIFIIINKPQINPTKGEYSMKKGYSNSISRINLLCNNFDEFLQKFQKRIAYNVSRYALS